MTLLYVLQMNDFSDTVCDTEFASNMTFKAVTSIINFYIPTTCMICLYVKIFLAIKRRSKDIAKFGAYTASGGPSATACRKDNNKAKAEAEAAEKNCEEFHSDLETQPLDRKTFERSLDHCSSLKSESSLGNGLIAASGSEFHRLAVVAFPIPPSTVAKVPERPRKDVSCETMSLFDGVKVKVEYVESPTNPRESMTYLQDISKRRPTCDVAIPLRQPLSANYREMNASPSPIMPVVARRDDQAHVNHLHCYRSKKMASNGKANHENGHKAALTRQLSSSFTGNQSSNLCKRFIKNNKLTAMINRRNATAGLSSTMANGGGGCRGPNRANPNTVLIKEKKAAMQLGVIVGAFILCWLPYFTLFMVVAYCSDADGQVCVNQTVFTSTIWFGYFNSTLNPILYPLCNANFKRAFKRMLGLSSRNVEIPPQVINNLHGGPALNNRTTNHQAY